MGLKPKHILFGKPIPTWHALHARLPKLLALPVFASDAMSSVAYATQEIVIILGGAMGLLGLHYAMAITAAIVILLVIVATSYRQTIFAYPSGGGSYIVAKENLGTMPGLIAAASLLIDYTLTVSVSISAGVSALIALCPSMQPHRVLLCVVFIAFITLANLRGLRESGLLFALPAYTFIGSFAAMIAVGLYKAVIAGTLTKAPGLPIPAESTHLAGLAFTFLALKAFAGGCSAMTGTEAISNGIPAFRQPESKNAATTLVWMAIILATLFLGISYLAQYLHIVQDPEGIKTVVSQIAICVFGRGPIFWLVQIATVLILILAAETSFADFPRLTSILAKDRFMPRQLANIGDRLAFTNGIIALWALSTILVIGFGGEETKLIPLYAVGVFLSFTLSQAGMVVHTKRLKEKGWRKTVAISTVGAIATGIVAVVQLLTKLEHRSWIVAILIFVLVIMFRQINKHYMALAEQLRLNPDEPVERPETKNTVIVLVPSIHRGILPALDYAKSLSADCRALYVETDAVDTPLIEERWEKWGLGIPLVVLESPYRSVVQPVLDYLEEVKKDRVRHVVTVILPEFVPRRFWHKVLHNQSGMLLKFALLFKRDIVVSNLRYYLEK